jgi:hypothetical protein
MTTGVREAIEEAKLSEEKIHWDREKIEEAILNPLADGFVKTGLHYWFSGRRVSEDGTFIFEYLSNEAPPVEIHVTPDMEGEEENESD